MTDGLKPQEQWDREDLHDYLDGWDEACGLNFKSKRDPNRIVRFVTAEGARVEHTAAALMAAGRAARERHQS